MWFLVLFLLYNTILTWQYTLGQFEYLINQMLLPFVNLIIFNIITLIQVLYPLFLEYNILPVIFGAIIGSALVKLVF